MLDHNRDWLPGFTEDFREKTMDFVKDLEKCLQCGKCVGVCPAARLSPHNSRQMIRDLVIGQIERVISSRELWMCFFCASCYAACPKNINFPFAVAMLRYAALAEGYGWEYVQKIMQPYANDYYPKGITVAAEERNPMITRLRATHSGTDGSIRAIRRRMGRPEVRTTSEKALTEIQFISDVTGMTRGMKEIATKKRRRSELKYGTEFIRTRRNAQGKFIGFMRSSTASPSRRSSSSLRAASPATNTREWKHPPWRLCAVWGWSSSNPTSSRAAAGSSPSPMWPSPPPPCRWSPVT